MVRGLLLLCLVEWLCLLYLLYLHVDLLLRLAHAGLL